MNVFERFKGKKIEIYFKHGSKDVTSGVVKGSADNWLIIGRGDEKVTYLPFDNIARFEEVMDFEQE
ncbi:MAG: hypothetical protein QGG87_00415 [Nitrospinota bacterium]|jgi:ribosome maturation factor RimP|nr:hypothetical protein [Nitrospinota bacterium]|tara:strand:+ start:2553 stop:2750 length:198 start_codon:yes stop_codon:yes gene_type:complete